MITERIPVLIVDDDPDYVDLLRNLLDAIQLRAPFAITSVTTAADALAAVRRTRYELMLLDNRLPGATGLDVLQELGRLPVELQPAVIMLTATGSEEVAVEAMKRGAKDYLSKVDLHLPGLHRAITGALQRHWLERQLREKSDHLAADLRMAREVQQAFLPQRYPTFPGCADPDHSALRFTHRYLPSTQVGGDFFDVLALSDTEAGVLVCDVSGHGLRAALVTAILRGLVEELLFEAHDPGRFLSALNRGLREILKGTRPPLFVSAFYLLADVERRELRYATAGHPAPFHLQRTAARVAPLDTDHTERGVALGVLDNQVYPTHTAAAAPGDLILLYTDGLFEVEVPNGELYGEQRLQAAVQERAHLPADRLLDDLLAHVRRNALQHNFTDDVCVVGMEIYETA